MQVSNIMMIVRTSWDEIERVCNIAKGMDHCDFIVAIGGGKAVDLGKGVATVTVTGRAHA